MSPLRQFIPSDQLADDLRISRKTPPTWRARRIGPPWFKVGRVVYYDPADVEEWLKSRRFDPAAAARDP
jgi:hypothetical protein